VKEKQSFRLVSLCATIQKFAQRAKKKKKKAANVSTRKRSFFTTVEQRRRRTKKGKRRHPLMMDENNESFRSLSLSPKRFPHIMNHKKTKRTYPAPFAVSTFTCSLKHSAHVTCPLAHSITSQSPNSVSSE
jgi:hypothetical protein